MLLPCRRALAIRLCFVLYTRVSAEDLPRVRNLTATHLLDSSRTRLVKDLTPRSKDAGRFEVATTVFARGSPRHAGQPEEEETRAPRYTYQMDAERLERRRSRRLERIERNGQMPGTTPLRRDILDLMAL